MYNHEHFHQINADKLGVDNNQDLKILILYGSLRTRSYSRLLAEESGRILEHLGCTVKFFDPSGLPLYNEDPNSNDVNHAKVQELRSLTDWCDGMVWSSPEIHGTISSVMKTQIDWIPLSIGSVRPTQGKTLAVMQVSGGSQSFNSVNQLRQLGRWMRLITIPNQSSVAKAFNEFNSDGSMRPSAFYNRVVDVMEELVKFTMLTKPCKEYLVERYSERVESAEELAKRVSSK